MRAQSIVHLQAKEGNETRGLGIYRAHLKEEVQLQLEVEWER